MITNVNPSREAIPWSDFLLLCKSCNLVPTGPDAQNRYKFVFDQTEVMHQVTKLKSDNLKASGWFSYVFGTSSEWNSHRLTAGGHVAVIETINPHSPMTKEHQPRFAYMVDWVLLCK